MIPALPKALDLRWDEGPVDWAPAPDRDRSEVWRGYLVALALLAAAAGVRAGFGVLLADRMPYMPFLLAVVFASWFGGLGPALLALLGGVAFHVFTLHPAVDRDPQVSLAHQLG